MQRLIWFSLTLVALVVFVLWQRGGTKTAYVNGLPQFTHLPNQEYILQRDCYIFKFNEEDSSYPLIGINDNSLASAVGALPNEVTAANVGGTHGSVRILSSVKTGTRFRIVSVRQDQRRNQTKTTFEILLLPEAEHPYPRLDAYWIMNHDSEQSGGVPSIIGEIAAPRVKT